MCKLMHRHRLLLHSWGNYSRKSMVIIPLTRPRGRVDWRIGARTAWKRLRKVWVQKGTGWTITNGWLLFYLLQAFMWRTACTSVCLCPNARDSGLVCLHVHVWPWIFLKWSQEDKTMTSHYHHSNPGYWPSNNISVILFTGCPVHWVIFWFASGGLQHRDPVAEINVFSPVCYSLLESSVMLLGSKTNSTL